MSGVRIPDLPDLGAVTDATEFVADYGGSGVVRAVALRNYVAGNATGNSGRNVLHNGRFSVWQRGAGPFTTNGYTADRWMIGAATDTMSVTQLTATDSDRTAIGDESVRTMLQVAVVGSAGSGSFSTLSQPIERLHRLAGKTATLSFWARATAGTPKLGINALQNPGTGGSPSALAWALATGNTVTLSTTWTRYTSVITMPSAVGKTTGTNDNSYTGPTFWTSAGSGTPSAPSGGIGVQSFTLQLWGVQLEIGSTATALDALDPEDELRRCQRFYQAGQSLQVFGSSQSAGNLVAISNGLPTTMRATPTVTFTPVDTTNVTSPAAGALGPGAVNMSGTVAAIGPFALTLRITASADL